MLTVQMRRVAPFLLLSGICFGESAKVARDLTRVDRSSTVDVIVQFSGRPDAAQAARVRALAGNPKADLSVINAAVYSIPGSAIESLSDSPGVAYVSPDREVTATLDFANTAVGAQSARQYGWNGTGVGV